MIKLKFLKWVPTHLSPTKHQNTMSTTFTSFSRIYVPEDVQKQWDCQVRNIIEEVLNKEPIGECKNYVTKHSKDNVIFKAHNNIELFRKQVDVFSYDEDPISYILNALRDDIFEMPEEEYRENGTTTLSLDEENLRDMIISFINNETKCDFKEVTY